VDAANQVLARTAPNGFIPVFGGARLEEGEPNYELARRFAFLWTQKHGDQIPIGSGGGPGAMMAANQGASQAHGKSLAFVKEGLLGEKPNPHATDSHAFASFTRREDFLIDGGRAYVFVAGGVGTHWELFQVLAKIEAGVVAPKNLILLGKPAEWAATKRWVDRINPGWSKRLKVVDNAEEAVRLAESEVDSNPFRNRMPTPPQAREEAELIHHGVSHQAPHGFVTLFGSDSAKSDQPWYKEWKRTSDLLTGRQGVGPIKTLLSGPRGEGADHRDSELIDRASAAVFYPGGFQTQWKLFELLTKLETFQIEQRPVILAGPRRLWRPFYDLLDHAVANHTAVDNIRSYVKHAETPERVLRLIKPENLPFCDYGALE
jgi:predicted Rossmann-fold nucleotide-binding protein